MSRANSLKKALRQIIDHTEQGLYFCVGHKINAGRITVRVSIGVRALDTSIATRCYRLSTGKNLLRQYV
jgi:hypothetical protein